MTPGPLRSMVTAALLAAWTLAAPALPAEEGGAGAPARPPGPARAVALPGQAGDAPRPPADYRIGPGDLLEVTVFEEESLNRTVRVGPDGSIGLPLLGAIQAGGRRRGELESEIVRRLAEQFLFNPQVSVFVKEYRSRRVAVMGAVNSPGSYEMLGRRSLLEVISEAGGLAENAGRDLFVFGRAADGTMARTRIDLDRLLREGDASLNLLIIEGDIINVPVEKPMAVYLYGAVGQPGMVEGRSSDGLTLLQAISRAGGPGPRAALDRIVIIRAAGTGKVRIAASLKKILEGKQDDVALMPDDVVVVPETFF